MAESMKQRLTKRVGQLRSDFSTWEAHFRELAEHMAPRRARWNRKDFNRGDKINGTIINNTPLIAGRTLASGLMVSVTNPMSEWFRLTTPDPDLGEYAPVKRYLNIREQRLRWAFSMGSFYRGLADGVYPDLGVFGHSCALFDEDPRRIVSLTPFPLGEYYLGTNAAGEVDAVYREQPMTVKQMVEQFCLRPDRSLDLSVLSAAARNLWNQGSLETVVEVVHAVEPAWDFEPGVLGPLGMPWLSAWYEPRGDEDKLLRRGGFEEFPFLCPRWSPRGGESYGRSPGQEVLGDCKQLQHHERRLALLIDMQAKPPMVADDQMRGSRASTVPGDTIYVPRGQTEGFRQAVKVDPQAVVSLLNHIERCEGRIEEGMFANLFARVLSDDRAQRATATEIEEISREVASLIGPALFRLDAELYSPAISRAGAILERRGYLPPPPPELEGQEIKAEYISVLHQAQKGVGLQPLRVFIGEVSALASVRPDALDKLNADEIVDEIATLTGVKPDLVLSDDEVAALRQQRAERQQAMEQGQAALAAAKGVKDMATAPAPAPDNALGAVLANLSPEGATDAAIAPFGAVAQGIA